MSDLEDAVKQRIDAGNPEAATALAILGLVDHLAQIAVATERITAVLERADVIHEEDPS